ncbi:adenosine kinase [Sphingomonas astaxanthinifaciens]|uniref:Adenosine kinase n=1 Tax=Sphingomonas astaxanthinifaciens DSM 22298 TaxID=1123267 RepID=A0ABQ5Z666_9SPHN|nr:adenosine kinase [Sphingomonas astaxanthinifaciens]GLR47535.1 adenosine kinase [Sphingomonas astaxanthinifaciens DSM 22298]
MTQPRYDVLAIGNAIVDVIADADDAFLAAEGLVKGSMRLVDEAESAGLYSRMRPGREISGGSAGNTAAGLAALGCKVAYAGQVADDQLGAIYAHDISAQGIDFIVAPRGGIGATATSLILVTPDAQRTMNTFLGACQRLELGHFEPEIAAEAGIVYLEGYLWSADAPRAAMLEAIAIAKEAGRRVALTLSDSFVVDAHRAEFLQLIEDGKLDILFGNAAELAAMAGEEDFDSAVAALAERVPLLVATHGEHGAVAVRGDERARVAAEPISQLVDTTGAGDLFAAGFLAGEVRGLPLEQSLRLGAIAAAEVIQHYGARPEADLKVLAGDLLA